MASTTDPAKVCLSPLPPYFASLSSRPFQIVTDQRRFFKTGATRCVEFRKEQLKKMREMIEQYKDRICQAIHKDLRRHPETNMQMEVGWD